MSIIYLVPGMFSGLRQEDIIRLEMIAVYSIMIFHWGELRMCFQAINAHVNVSNNVVYKSSKTNTDLFEIIFSEKSKNNLI